jgi:hypothetical protein
MSPGIPQALAAKVREEIETSKVRKFAADGRGAPAGLG